MSHAFLFYFFLKTNSINFVLFIRNARAPSLKFMYKILNQSDNFKWVVRHFRIFQYINIFSCYCHRHNLFWWAYCVFTYWRDYPTYSLCSPCRYKLTTILHDKCQTQTNTEQKKQRDWWQTLQLSRHRKFLKTVEYLEFSV